MSTFIHLTLITLIMSFNVLTAGQSYHYAIKAEKERDQLTLNLDSDYGLLTDGIITIVLDKKNGTYSIGFHRKGITAKGLLPFHIKTACSRFAALRLQELTWSTELNWESAQTPPTDLYGELFRIYGILSGMDPSIWSNRPSAFAIIKSGILSRRIGHTTRQWNLTLQSQDKTDKSLPESQATLPAITTEKINCDLISPFKIPAFHCSPKRKSEIMRPITQLIEGFQKRDIQSVDTWCHSILHPDIQLIGTGSLTPGGYEWFTGIEHCPRVFKNDWKNWGEVTFDLDDLHIYAIDAETAAMDIPAIISKKKPQELHSREDSLKGALERTGEYISDDSLSIDQRASQIIWDLSRIMKQYSFGSTFSWPLRISGVLKKYKQKWVFIQMHWSHPSRGFPSHRLIDNDRIIY